MRHLTYSYTSFLILSVISGFWVQISFERQHYLIFKSSSICRKFPSSVQLPVWLSEYPVMHNFLPWKESPFTRYPAWQCLSVSLSTSPLGGHTPQSAPRMTSCPQGPWEVVINCRQCGKITGGQFLCVTPYSANPKMNFNYQQPLSKDCFSKKSDQQWRIEFKVSRVQLWMFSWYFLNKPA